MGARVRAGDPLLRLGSSTFVLPLAIALLVLAGRVWNLGGPPLASSEGVRSLTAHQMVESGHWLTPMLYERVYLRKPPLYYWMLAAAETVTGTANEWVWRLPSVIISALLGAFLTVTARRWFGPIAAVVTGLSYLALFVLIMEGTRAEIDAANTAAATVCAVALLELFVGPGRRGRWAVIAGLALGAALLLKGHAGLIIVAGALPGPPAAVLARRTVRRKAGKPARGGPGKRRRGRPWAWVALAVVIGASLFGLWILAMVLDAKARGLTLTLEGFNEAAFHATPFKGYRRLESLLVPPTLFLFAAPVSFGLLYALCPSIHGRLSRGRRRRLFALVAAFIVAMLVCVACVMINPRYGYVCLPLLTLIAGGAAQGAARGPVSLRVRRSARWGVALFIACLALAPAGIAIATAMRASASAAQIVIAAAALATGAWWAMRRPAWLTLPAAIAVAALLLAPTLSFRILADFNTAERSGQRVADELRACVTGPGDGPGAAPPTVHANSLIFGHPELLHYAGVHGKWIDPPGGVLAGVTEAGWVIFTLAEWEQLRQSQRSRISRVTHLHWSTRHAVLGWYRPPLGP